MKYNGAVINVARRFKGFLEGIAAEYNFDYGIEFEIAICQALRVILPDRFGVCRGFLVTAEGECAGDDIIVYDRMRFPTLRLIGNQGFAQKEQIPIEAAYAYIEAKNSLIIEGEKQNILKAIKQVERAKAIAVHREPVRPMDGFDPYVRLPIALASGSLDNWPAVRNPFFGALFARHVRITGDSEPLESGSGIRSQMKGLEFDTKFSPDLIVAGEDVVLLPFVEHGGNMREYHSPFFIEDKSHLAMFEKKGLAFAIGICSFLYALDTIRLGAMPWPSIIADGIDVELSTSKSST